MTFRSSAGLPILLLSALGLGALLTGCVATTTDVDRLQGSLGELEKTQASMQRSQADLISKMDELDHSLASMTERLDDSQKRMAALTQKIDDLQTRMGTRMEGISQLLSAATTQASVPVPSEIYRTAYGDYLNGKSDLAISEFKTFIDRYPNSDLVADAQYYLADSYLQKKDYYQARVEFDKYLGQYTDMRAAALLKRAAALGGMKKDSDQEHTLRELIKEFPNSSEAQSAKQVLNDLSDEAPAKKPARHKARSKSDE